MSEDAIRRILDALKELSGKVEDLSDSINAYKLENEKRFALLERQVAVAEDKVKTVLDAHTHCQVVRREEQKVVEDNKMKWNVFGFIWKGVVAVGGAIIIWHTITKYIGG